MERNEVVKTRIDASNGSKQGVVDERLDCGTLLP